MQIRIRFNGVPNLLFIGYKKDIGSLPKEPLPFLFFSPEDNGYQRALERGEQLLRYDETLLSVEKAEIGKMGEIRVAFSEVYGEQYGSKADWLQARQRMLLQKDRKKPLIQGEVSQTQEEVSVPVTPVKKKKVKPQASPKKPQKKSLLLKSKLQKKKSKR